MSLSRAAAGDFASRIIYENRHLLLVYKPHGLPVQRDASGDPSLLDSGKAYLIERYNKPGNAYLSLPQRLDRPAAGLCVMAKTTKAMRRLSAAFRQKNCKKFYLAIVEGTVTSPLAVWQEQVDYLRKDSRNNKSFAGPAGHKLAKLKYCLVAANRHSSIIAVQLETGRHHQIRCQLAALGHPIRGDYKYGAGSGGPKVGIRLYAFALQVPLPIQESELPYSKGPFVWEACDNNKRVLQSVCLPWEHPHAKELDIWQLCTRNPQILKGLRAIFQTSF